MEQPFGARSLRVIQQLLATAVKCTVPVFHEFLPMARGCWQSYCTLLAGISTREKRDLERKCRENIDSWVKVVHCVHSRPASTVDSALWSDAVQNKLCWLACYVHNRPPSPKFQILTSKLRQMADRADSLSIKGPDQHQLLIARWSAVLQGIADILLQLSTAVAEDFYLHRTDLWERCLSNTSFYRTSHAFF